ncbi:MAG: hypothetical protein ACTSRZ_06795 [Promethearchaeota archaeon]
MNEIKVTPICSDSFGVRGFCIRVITPDLIMLLDPGCALGPRQGYRIPHPFELKKLYQNTNKIIKEAKRAQYIFISHYHHDHFKPNIKDYLYIHTNKQIFEDIFKNKIIFAKDPENFINYNQKQRGIKFFGDIKKNGCKFNSKIYKIALDEQYTDLNINNGIKQNKGANSCSFLSKLRENKDIKQVLSIGNTNLIFPYEFLHGHFIKNKIFVQPLIINYQNENVFFFSDVQGFPDKNDFQRVINLKNTLNHILIDLGYKRIFNTIALSGPVTYIFPKNIPKEIQNALNNIPKLIKKFNLVFMDHHLVRDENFPAYFAFFKLIGRQIGDKQESEHDIKLFNPEMDKILNDTIAKENLSVFINNFSSNQPLHKLLENLIKKFENQDIQNLFSKMTAKNILTSNKIKDQNLKDSIEKKIFVMECMRKFLYENYPPLEEFMRWAKKVEVKIMNKRVKFISEPPPLSN